MVSCRYVRTFWCLQVHSGCKIFCQWILPSCWSPQTYTVACARWRKTIKLLLFSWGMTSVSMHMFTDGLDEHVSWIDVGRFGPSTMEGVKTRDSWKALWSLEGISLHHESIHICFQIGQTYVFAASWHFLGNITQWNNYFQQCLVFHRAGGNRRWESWCIF